MFRLQISKIRLTMETCMGIQKSNGTVPLRTKFRLTMFRLTRVDCNHVFIQLYTSFIFSNFMMERCKRA
jgi:hypothetical protein